MSSRTKPQRDTKDTLELFVEKAEKLEIYKSEVKHFGGLLGVIRNSDEEQWRTHPELDGFLLTFRMFIQNWDGIAIYEVSRGGQVKQPAFLDLPVKSNHWHETVEQAYTFMNIVLTIPLPNLSYNNKPLTRWKILDTFLYGEHGHATKRKTYKRWQRLPDLYAAAILEFSTTLVVMSEQIRIIAEACKRELELLKSSTSTVTSIP